MLYRGRTRRSAARCLALLSFCAIGAAANAAASERTGDLVSCKLPPQVRKLASGQTRQMPGPVVRVSAAECKRRGGRIAAASTKTADANRTGRN